VHEKLRTRFLFPFFIHEPYQFSFRNRPIESFKEKTTINTTNYIIYKILSLSENIRLVNFSTLLANQIRSYPSLSIHLSSFLARKTEKMKILSINSKEIACFQYFGISEFRCSGSVV